MHVENVYKIAWAVARTLFKGSDHGIDCEDLVSCGVLGALEAWERFDCSQGVLPETFLRYRIRGAMLDELRRIDHLSKNQRRLFKTITTLMDKSGNQLGISEICEQLEINREKYDKLMLASSMREWRTDLVEMLADQNSVHEPVSTRVCASDREFLAESIESLEERERKIIKMRYYEEMKLEEVGDVLDLSVGRVAQLQKRAQDNLAAIIEEENRKLAA